MPIFEKPPLETLSMARDRWTPLYLEHGRLEVDDSSVKWISSQKLVCRIPVATVSALILGPGTTVTHAAIKACADSNTPVIWMGEDQLFSLRFQLMDLVIVLRAEFRGNFLQPLLMFEDLVPQRSPVLDRRLDGLPGIARPETDGPDRLVQQTDGRG